MSASLADPSFCRDLSLSCHASTSAECFDASLPLDAGSSRAPRTSEPSRALRLLLPPLPRSCVYWSLLLWSFSSFAVVFIEPSCSFSLHQPVLPCAVVWNTFTRCSISPSRGLVERLVRVFLRALSVGDSSHKSFVLSQRGSDVF